MLMIRIYRQSCLALTAVMMICYSCKKDDYVGKDPYAGAKDPLAIKVNTVTAVPGAGAPGTIVTLSGSGFMQYKDSGMVVKFNDVEGEITQVSDTVLKAKVPSLASSGLVTLTVLHQVFPGPYFQVRGPIQVDTMFHSIPGADNGNILCVQFVPGGKYLIGGNFEDYDNSGLKDGYHGIARINADGSIDRSFKVGKGVQGLVNTIAVQASGKYILGGNFNDYDERFSGGYISNIARLNPDGSMDSTIVQTQAGHQDTVPSLNAYFDGQISKVLQTSDSGKLVVIGDFKYYMRKDFTIATADGLQDSVKVDSIRMEGIARLNEDGSFDSSFNYNSLAHAGYTGTNGPVYDAFIQDDGKVIIAGNFSKYRDQPANNVARLNRDGSLDNTFNTGSGPDDRVFSAWPLSGGKCLIAGQFNKVNGKESRKVAVLGPDGSADNSFSVGTGPNAGPDGIVYKAGALKNGKLFIAGFFDAFSGIKRNGTVILNADGSISDQYNNLGAMESNGQPVAQMLNVPNDNATILVGTFTKYDLQPANGILLLKY